MCSCARNNPPVIPAIKVAPEVDYLWPKGQEQISLSQNVTSEELGPDSSIGIENGIIAVVGDKVITLNEFDYEFMMALRAEGSYIDGPKLYVKVLDFIIERLLLLELAKQKDIKVSEDAINDAFDDHLKKVGMSFKEYRSVLAEQKKSIIDMKQTIEENLSLAELDQHIFRGLFAPPPRDVLAEYNKKKELYSLKAQRDVSLIVVFKDTYSDKTKTEKHIKKIYARLEHEPFDEVAKQYSDGSKASKGGRQGYVTQGDLAKPIADAAFALKKGEISGIGDMRAAYFIVKCHDIQKAKIVPFKKVQQEIKNKLLYEMRMQRKRKAVNEMKKLIYIRRLSPDSYQKYRNSVHQ